jgi:hypothetical protein
MYYRYGLEEILRADENDLNLKDSRSLREATLDARSWATISFVCAVTSMALAVLRLL